MYGPTVLDFASHLSVSITIMATMATVNSVGLAIGGSLSGFGFDQFPNHTFWMLLAILITDSICKKTFTGCLASSDSDYYRNTLACSDNMIYGTTADCSKPKYNLSEMYNQIASLHYLALLSFH